MAKKEFISTKEAAEDMGVSIRTIQNWITKGIVPAYKLRFGRMRLIEKHVWEEWKARNIIRSAS